MQVVSKFLKDFYINKFDRLITKSSGIIFALMDNFFFVYQIQTQLRRSVQEIYRVVAKMNNSVLEWKYAGDQHNSVSRTRVTYISTGDKYLKYCTKLPF